MLNRRSREKNIMVATRLIPVGIPVGIALGSVLAVALTGCTQETQNKIGRSLQNWTGANGVLEIYSGGELVKRFIEIDKLSTATSTQGGDMARPYRFAYGVLDNNLNGKRDNDERKVYFEISDYSTNYVFYGDPGN